MDWTSKLVQLGVPENMILESAPNLEAMGLDPRNYNSLQQLYATLKGIMIHELQQRGKVMQEGSDPLQWLINIIMWIGQQIYSFIAPYAGDIALIAIGGISLFFLPGLYKTIGATPVVYGIWDVYNKVNPGPAEESVQEDADNIKTTIHWTELAEISCIYDMFTGIKYTIYNTTGARKRVIIQEWVGYDLASERISELNNGMNPMIIFPNFGCIGVPFESSIWIVLKDTTTNQVLSSSGAQVLVTVV